MIMYVKLVFPNGHERKADLPVLPRVGETMAFCGYDGDDPDGQPELVLCVREVRYAMRSYHKVGDLSFYDETIVFLVNPSEGFRS